MGRARRMLALGVICVGIAAAAYLTLQAALGPKPAAIHVRWASGTTEATRTASEHRYSLSQGMLLEQRTWSYLLRDTSATNIKALISDPLVEDTTEINRSLLQVNPASTRGPYPPAPRPWIPASLGAATIIFLFIGLTGLSLGLAEWLVPGATATWSVPREASPVPLLPRQKRMVLLLLATLLALDLGSMRHMTVTNDEPHHFEYGRRILALDSTRLTDSGMPVSALNALPSVVAERLPKGSLSAFLERIETGRYLTVFASILVALCVFGWARNLYGVNAGLLALTLYVFDPNLLAHSQLVTTDLYAAGTVTFALYFFWRFLHLGGWKRALASALLLGVAQIAKYTAVALLPLFAVIALGFHARDIWSEVRGRRFRALFGRAAVFSSVGLGFVLACLLVVNAGFLFNQTLTTLEQYSFQSDLFRSIQSSAGVVGRLPLPVPYPYTQGLDLVVEHERTGSSFGRVYLLGQLRQGEGFPGYYLWASLYKWPIATLLVIGAAVVVLIARRRQLAFLRNEAVLYWPILFFMVYFNFFYRAQIGIRYVLVVVPLLYVLSGSLVAEGTTLTRPMKGALTTAIGALILSVLSHFPHFLPYFNELVWDPTKAYTVLADSNIDWGQNRWYLAKYTATHPDVVVEPNAPTAGTILVGVNKLTGVTDDPERFRWLREHFTPVDHVAYATLVYKVSKTDLERLGLQQGSR